MQSVQGVVVSDLPTFFGEVAKHGQKQEDALLPRSIPFAQLLSHLSDEMLVVAAATSSTCDVSIHLELTVPRDRYHS